MNRFRKRVRAMARIAAGSSLNLQSANELYTQLVEDLHAQQQEQQSLTQSLTDEQRTANQDRLKEMSQREQDLELFSEALGFELEQASIDNGKIQEQVRKLDEASKSLDKQQHHLAEDLGID